MIAQLDICVQEKIRLCVCAFWKPSMLATITLVTVTINIHPALQSMIPSTKMPTAGDIQAHITVLVFHLQTQFPLYKGPPKSQ
jgi:hypothetical protein